MVKIMSCNGISMGISLGNIPWAKKTSPRPTAHPINSCFSAKLWGPVAFRTGQHERRALVIVTTLAMFVQRPKPTVDEMFQILTNDINLQQLGWWSGYTWNFGILIEPSAIRMMIWIHLKFAGDLATSWKNPRSSQSGLRPQSEILSTESSIIWTQYQWRISSCRKVWKTI